MTLAAVVCAVLAVLLAGAAPPALVRVRRIVSDSGPPHGQGPRDPGREVPRSRRRLALRSRRRPAPRRPGARPAPLESRRGRALASVALGVAGAVVVGGVGGLAVGVGVCVTAWLGLARLRTDTRGVDREHAVLVLPVVTRLLVAALEAGCPPTTAVETVGEAMAGPVGGALTAAARSAQFSAGPEAAWQELAADPVLRPIGRALAAATIRGTSPVAVLERAGIDAQDAARWAAQARANSLGAKAAAPLGLCFLPAFVVVGIVPIVATSGIGLL